MVFWGADKVKFVVVMILSATLANKSLFLLFPAILPECRDGGLGWTYCFDIEMIVYIILDFTSLLFTVFLCISFILLNFILKKEYSLFFALLLGLSCAFLALLFYPSSQLYLYEIFLATYVKSQIWNRLLFYFSILSVIISCYYLLYYVLQVLKISANKR